jgi:Asp/Glu/hydantoin racemase
MTTPHNPTAGWAYKPTSTPTLGVLMLRTGFPRLPGDVGHPQTWAVPTRYRVVEAADVASVVKSGPLPLNLLMAFIDAAWSLVEDGATLITTSCGFLVTAQKALGEALPVPVVTSSLLQIPQVQAGLPDGRRVGILTFDARRLSEAQLAAAGAPPDTPLVGLEDGAELHRVITQDLKRLDPAAAEADVLAAGAALKEANPDLGAVVLECTNLSPYRAALAATLDLPVYDLVSLVEARLGKRRS